MSMINELQAYKARWAEVEKIVAEERRSATLELRWQQLNSSYTLARDLGLLVRDPSEVGVFDLWARLKERAASQLQKI